MNTITTSSATTGDHASRAARRTVRRDAGRAGGRRAGHLVGAALIAAALGASAGAQAARFGVRVVDAFGEPVAGASVCVGLEGNYRQFGTAFTDADGLADMLEVPNVPLVVTVSKTRFAGTRLQEPGRGFDIVRELTLVEGLPGPRCRAGSSMAANPPIIDVRDVAVTGEGTGTTLTPTVTGSPSEYRVALDGDLLEYAGGWQRFDTTITLPRALADARSIVLQLRRQVGDERASIEALSDVVTVELAGDDEPSDG